MKANCMHDRVKLTANKIDTHVMVWVVSKYGKRCLNQLVTRKSARRSISLLSRI